MQKSTPQVCVPQGVEVSWMYEGIPGRKQLVATYIFTLRPKIICLNPPPKTPEVARFSREAR